MNRIDTSTLVAAHDTPWATLGTTLQGNFTAEQAMAEGRLGGWNVRKQQMFTRWTDTHGKRRIMAVPNRVAIVRDSPTVPDQVDYLGVTGNDYQPVQNEQHAEFLNILVDESGANFNVAGALDGGTKTFMSMVLPGHINVGGVDPVINQISSLNSHDGSMSFTIMVAPLRYACANVLNMPFKGRPNMFRVRHSSGAEKNIRHHAREVLDLTFKSLEGFQEQAERLINTTLTQDRFEEIVMKEFGPSKKASPAATTRSQRKVDQMVELFADAGTQAEIRDTAWAGLNAITEWSDHYAPTRGTERDAARARKAILSPAFKTRALQLMAKVK